MEPSALALETPVTLSAIAVWVLEKLKTCPRLPWIHEASRTLNRVISVVLAAVAAAGIHWTFDGGAGVFTISGITPENMMHVGWEILRSFVFQELIYQGVVSKAAAPAPDAPQAKGATAS